MKTIDIQAKEWFDKVNGNSYFSAEIVIDFGMESQKTLKLPFQYGYGDQYISQASFLLNEHNYISLNDFESLWRYCDRNKIILKTVKTPKCTKREVREFGISL